MKTLTIVILTLTVCFYVVAPALAADDTANKVLKQGILGAGTGAVAAGASGGKAGKGALIGAGTGILGNILLDTLSGGSQTQPTPQQQQQTTRTVDLYQEAYQEGYADGFKDGYKEGLNAAVKR